MLNTTGLIIKEHIVGESDKYITLFTKELGKIQVIAYRAKKSERGLASATQLFTYGHFIISAYKETYKLINAEIISTFYGIRQDLEALAYAAYIGEFIDGVTEEGLSSKELLEISVRTLLALEKKLVPFYLIRRIFELRMLSALGFMPQLYKCANCGKILKDTSKTGYSFAVSAGGMICETCKEEYDLYLSLAYNTLYTLRYIIGVPLNKLFSFTVNDQIQKELDQLCKQYIDYYIDKKFKTLGFIEKIQKVQKDI